MGRAKHLGTARTHLIDRVRVALDNIDIFDRSASESMVHEWSRQLRHDVDALLATVVPANDCDEDAPTLVGKRP